MANVMLELDDESFVVLNAIVLKKSAGPDAVVQATGLAAEAVARVVAELTSNGQVTTVDGLLRPHGSAVEAVRRYNDTHWAGLRADPAVHRWQRRFEQVNELMLAALAAWQQGPANGQPMPNEHTDAGYDDKVISRIDGIIAKAEGLLGQLGNKVARFERYSGRLEEAMDRVAEDYDYVSNRRVESVHNIWSELHEDILLLLGAQRGK